MRSPIPVLSLLLAVPPLVSAETTAGTRSVAEALTIVERLPQYEQTVISPDGKRVAWVEVVNRRGSVPGGSRIGVVELATGRTTRVSATTPSRIAKEGDIAWSPDGALLAFVSDAAESGQPQLYVAELAKGRSRRLTQLHGDVASPAFSPDGRRLAFRHTADASAASAATTAAARETGVVGVAWPVARIAVIDSGGGTVRTVSPPDLFVFELDWSPDGTSLAATAARGPGISSWFVAQLFKVVVGSGETRALSAPTMQIARPRWKPDGSAIALLGGLMSDEGVDGGDVWLVPADGSTPINLTEGRRSSPSSFTWSGPDRLIVAEWDGGGCAVVALRPSDRHVETLWRGDEHLGGSRWQVSLSVARDGMSSAVVRSTFDRPPSVEAGPIGRWKPIKPSTTRMSLIGNATSLTWTTDVGDVQGWLLSPPNVESTRRYPLVVAVHGGPSAAFTPHAGFTMPVLLASQGYFVLLPNPRGSFGRGEAFTRANIRDFGGGDLRDILAGVDAVLASAPIDPTRVGVYGWSYGGFIAIWSIAQSNRFRAAVAGAGVANWVSYYGTSLMERWMSPFFGATPYDDLEAYRRCSAIEHARNVRTPTLFLHGERDAEVPVAQSREMWTALRTLGVPTQLVVFPGEGHVPRSPAHRREAMARTVAWFDRWLAVPALSVPR